MRGVRVHGGGLAKVAAFALVLVLALRLLPTLLAPPEPPPPAADVGLPRVAAAALEPAPPVRPAKPRFETDARRPQGTTEHGVERGRRLPRFETDTHRPKGTTESMPASTAAATAPSPLPPPPAPVPPPPPPPPPSDGSEEFAPR